MNEQPTTYHDNFGRAFYYEKGRRVYVDEKQPAQGAPAAESCALNMASNLGQSNEAGLCPKCNKTHTVLDRHNGKQWCPTCHAFVGAVESSQLQAELNPINTGSNADQPRDPGLCPKCKKARTMVHNGKQWCPICASFVGTGEASTQEAQNLDRWVQSGLPAKWVADRRGQWTHPDWLNLLGMLNQSNYWPMEPDAIGRVLEGQKKAQGFAGTAGNRPVSSSSHSPESPDEGATELPPMLKDSAHLGLYHRNGFRVLELPVEASVRDLTKRRQIVEAAATNGLPVPAGPGRVLPLTPTPDTFATREAVQRLTDPERRMVDEFFWFWPHQAGSSREDAALRLLYQENHQAAEQIWLKQEREQSQALVSTHNLAILHHLKALEYSERHLEDSNETSNGQGKFDSGVERNQWEQAFGRWVVLLREEEFWSRLTARIRELDDPRLTTGTARRIRSGLPLAILLINAQLALKAAEKNNLNAARDHVTMMRASSFNPSSCDNALSLATEPIRTRLKSLSKAATKEAGEHPEKADDAGNRLLEQSKPLLAIVDCLLPENHPARGAVHDDVAIAALDCCIAFGNKTKNWRKCLVLCDAMMPIPASVSAKERLKGNYETIKGNIEYGTCWFCSRNDARDKHAYKTDMYGNVRVEGNTRRWNYRTVEVPRCGKCKAYRALLITGAILFGAFFEVPYIFAMKSLWDFACRVMKLNSATDGAEVFFTVVATSVLYACLFHLFVWKTAHHKIAMKHVRTTKWL